MGKIAKVKFLKKGLQKPIYGLFLDEETVLSQYPAKTIAEAAEFFKNNHSEELLAEGYAALEYEGTKIFLN